MGVMIVTDEAKVKLMSDVGEWDSLEVFLFTDPGEVHEDTEWLDLTEADYSGYTRQTAEYSLPVIDVDGQAARVLDELTFSHDGGATANSVRGWGVKTIVDDHVMWLKLFDVTPVSFAGEGDFRKLNHTIRLDQV